MKFYNERGLLYLEKDALGIGLGPVLLQISDGMKCPWDKAHHNSILCPITFTSKSLSPVGKKIQQHSERRIRDTTWTKEMSVLLHYHRGKYNHIWEDIDNNPWERCSNTTAETSMHTIKNSGIHNQNNYTNLRQTYS